MDKAIKILKQEIDWHQKHTGLGLIGGKTDDWVDGFIKGCEHCLAVLTSQSSGLAKLVENQQDMPSEFN